MKPSSIVLVGLAAPDALAARQGAALEFPGAELAELPDLAAAEAAPGPACLAVSAALAQAALAKRDAEGLPRWAVVAVGGEEEGAEPLPAGERDSRSWGRAFCSACRQHALRRENARLKGDLQTLASRISHDVRSPLGFIYTGAEMIKAAIDDGDEPQPGMLQSLTRSVDEITQLIERVNWVARATVFPRPKEPVEMGDVVFGVLQRHEHALQAARSAVAQPPEWPRVAGVEPWLDVIWRQFVGNAVRHGRNPARITLGWEREPGGFRFWIEDSGPGVAPERRGGLFPAFHRLHQPDAPRGLGLAIVRRLVELQGGSCGHEAGSRFFFTLPEA